MANEKETRPREPGETRSLGGAVVQSLNDVKKGAGWTAGALIVGGAVHGAVHQGKKLLGKDENKD
jgi:hypothetical protein